MIGANMHEIAPIAWKIFASFFENYVVTANREQVEEIW